MNVQLSKAFLKPICWTDKNKETYDKYKEIIDSVLRQPHPLKEWKFKLAIASSRKVEVWDPLDGDDFEIVWDSLKVPALVINKIIQDLLQSGYCVEKARSRLKVSLPKKTETVQDNTPFVCAAKKKSEFLKYKKEKIDELITRFENDIKKDDYNRIKWIDIDNVDKGILDEIVKSINLTSPIFSAQVKDKSKSYKESSYIQPKYSIILSKTDAGVLKKIFRIKSQTFSLYSES